MTHLIGQQLGRYTIQEEIGRGGMARVYRAFDTMLKRTVAIKVLAPQLAVDPEFAQRFEREAVTAANLRHPNIVTIYDVGEQNGLRYIAMEYVRGRTLHAVIDERGALGLGFAIAIIGPVAAALDYAHTQGAVHRDIKPQNIMLADDGRVLLTDFGIAQAPEGGRSGERLTRTGIFMGTPEYISPEQASAQRVDGRSDLYSLGIATYEVITGAVPFSGATPQLIVAHAQTLPPPPSSLDPDQPPELDQVMARILAKRPEQRFPTGDEFMGALRAVARKYRLAVATQPQLAALVPPRASSAGESTISLGRGKTPTGLRAPVIGPPAPPPVPAAGSSDPTKIGQIAPRQPTQPPTLPSRARAVVPQSSLDDDFANIDPRSSRRAPPASNGGNSNLIIGAIVALVIVAAVALFIVRSNAAKPNPTIVPTARVATLIPTLAPTATPTLTPTPTQQPTEAPTAEPVATAEQQQPSPIPPVEQPSNTPEPPPDLPTDTPPELPTDIPTDAPTEEVTQTITLPTVEPTAAATSPPDATSVPAPTTEAPTTQALSPSPNPSATATVSPAPATATPSATVAATPTATTAPTPTTAATVPPTVTATVTAQQAAPTATATPVPPTATP